MRKNRAEFDVALAKDFYHLAGEFRAIEREWAALKRDHDASQPPGWADLLQRAAAAEGGVEAVLLKLVTEDAPTPQQMRAVALFRQGYQRLRDQIQRSELHPIRFQDPEYWLFHRLASEVSKLILERSTHSLSDHSVRSLRGAPQRYLRLIAFQEADWQMAVDGLATPIDDMLENRKRARRADITRCLGALTADQGGQLLANGDRPGHSTVVAFAVGAGDVSTASAKADELLSSCPTLRTYVVVPERREPILIFRRDRPRLRKLIDDDERVDLDLASGAIRLRAGDLRRWSASKPMLEALDAVATHDLVSSHS